MVPSLFILSLRTEGCTGRCLPPAVWEETGQCVSEEGGRGFVVLDGGGGAQGYGLCYLLVKRRAYGGLTQHLQIFTFEVSTF